MNQVIVMKSVFGGVAICEPTGEIPIEQVLTKDCPASASPRIVNKTDLPTDNWDFFNSWEFDKDNKIIVNFDKAIEQTKSRLRAERMPLLQKLDVDFQRALEAGADTSAIVSEKQRLRDIPNLADAATTLDELRAIVC